MEEAQTNNADNVAELTQKVETLKAKSDASKAAMKEARAKEKEEIQKQNAAKDPVKAMKMEVAKQCGHWIVFRLGFGGLFIIAAGLGFEERFFG